MENFLEVDPAGLEPAISRMQTGCSATELRAHVVGAEGIEPSTPFLSGMCSTTEPRAQYFLVYQKKRFFQAKNLFYLFNIFELFFKNFFNIGKIF